MAKTLFQLRSLRNGKIYRLTAREVQDFYHEHVLGRSARGSIGEREISKSPFKVVGTVLLQLWNAFGELRDVRAGANLVVTTGKNAIIDRLQAAAVAVHDYQALGTGTTAAAAGDTTLETELTGGSNARVQGTLSQPTALTDRLVSTFPAGNGTGAVTETGRLNASTVGNLMARQVFTVINKGASDSLQVTHDITVS